MANLLGTEHFRLVLYRLQRIRLKLIVFRGFGLELGVASQNVVHAPLYSIWVGRWSRPVWVEAGIPALQELPVMRSAAVQRQNIFGAIECVVQLHVCQPDREQRASIDAVGEDFPMSSLARVESGYFHQSSLFTFISSSSLAQAIRELKVTQEAQGGLRVTVGRMGWHDV